MIEQEKTTTTTTTKKKKIICPFESQVSRKSAEHENFHVFVGVSTYKTKKRI
jgi:hypothetical protein